MASGHTISSFQSDLNSVEGSYSRWMRGPSISALHRNMQQLASELTADHEGLMYEGTAEKVREYARAFNAISRLNEELGTLVSATRDAQKRLNDRRARPYQEYYDTMSDNQIMFWLERGVDESKRENARRDLMAIIRPMADTSYQRFINGTGPLIVTTENGSAVRRLASNWGVDSFLKERS